MEIIPLVLSERAADALPQELLDILAQCSGSVVKGRVKQYLDNSDANISIKHKVKRSYVHVFDIDDYLNDPQLKEQVDKVQDLTYKDIRADVPEEVLSEYRDILQSIIYNPNSKPYEEALDSNLVKSLIGSVKEYANVISADKPQDAAVLIEFCDKLKLRIDLFRDPRTKKSTGTVVRKIMSNVSKYEIILRGIDFQINNRRRGREPMQWRVL